MTIYSAAHKMFDQLISVQAQQLYLHDPLHCPAPEKMVAPSPRE